MRSVSMDRVDLSGNGTFYNGTTSKSITFPGSNSQSVSVGELDDQEVRLMLTLDSKSFDYQEFIFNFRHINITSVTAYVDDVIIPVEVSPLNGNDSDQSYTYLNVRLDFTQFDRNSSFQCLLNVTGYVPTAGETESVSVQYGVTQATGYILDSESDPGGYWMKMIWWDMRGWFGTLQNIVIQYINDFRTDMINHFNNLSGTLSSFFSNLNSNLDSNFDDLIDVLSPDTTPADQLQSEIDQQTSDLNSISSALENLDTPDLNDFSGDLSNYVQMDDVFLAATPMRNALNNTFFQNLFMIALTLMLASYVLYGKR